MRFGVFDHTERAAVSLDRFYADRLRLVEAYDRAGPLRLSRRRTPRDAARRGAVAWRVARRGGAARRAHAPSPRHIVCQDMIQR
jgi:hypothetical protein